MTIRVEAPAKVNLYLSVGPCRRDGYHEVRTVLCALDLCDEVVVESADTLRVDVDPSLGIEQSENLAWRAAEALGAAVGRDAAVHIGLRKRIPTAGGLGGGSSDAAAVLAALERAWGLGREDPRTSAVARLLGADVPFLLDGGCAVLGGRGDELERRLSTPRVCFALVNPGVPVSTAAAYAELDRQPLAASPGTRSIEAAVEAGDGVGIGAALFNGMTDASVRIELSITEELAALRSARGCLGAAMAGSGSTVFGVFAVEDDAADAAREASDRGLWTAVARPRVGGTRASVRGAVL